MKKNLHFPIYGDDIGYVECVDYLGSDLTVVNSARVSFGKHKTKLDEQDKKLIRYLIKHRHTSTLEHNFVTFRIKCPIYVAKQHMRHRTWSFNEISRRYTDENINIYLSRVLRKQSQLNRQASVEEAVLNNDDLVNEIDAHQQASVALYRRLIKEGVSREQARGILPQNLYTEYYASANLNNILKFIELRLHESSQWETQAIAKPILDISLALYPETVKAFLDCSGKHKLNLS